MLTNHAAPPHAPAKLVFCYSAAALHDFHLLDRHLHETFIFLTFSLYVLPSSFDFTHVYAPPYGLYQHVYCDHHCGSNILTLHMVYLLRISYHVNVH